MDFVSFWGVVVEWSLSHSGVWWLNGHCIILGCGGWMVIVSLRDVVFGWPLSHVGCGGWMVIVSLRGVVFGWPLSHVGCGGWMVIVSLCGVVVGWSLSHCGCGG